MLNSCDSLTWIDGITYTTSNNSATFNIVGGAVNGCDSLVTLDLTINNSNSGTDLQVVCDSYTWPLNSTTYTSSTNTPTVTLTNTAGCDSVVTLDLTISSVDTSTNTNNDTIMANQNGATYQWLNCDSSNTVILGETNQAYIATANGNYAVEVTFNGCTDTSTCVNVSTIGLDEISNLSGIVIYPNPTQNVITMNLINAGAINYSLFTIDGRVINQAQSILGNTLVLNLSSESKGVYFLKIENNKSSKVFKVIKQ